MNAKTQEKLRKQLEVRKTEIEDNVSYMADEIRAIGIDQDDENGSLGNHIADDGSNVSEAERLVVISEDFQEILGQINAALERMEMLFDKAGSTARMDKADKVSLYNDQELVNALLTKANKDSRIQCRREKRVGSHRTTSTCRTVAEWRRASQNSREDLEKRRSMGDILPQEKPGGRRGGGGL